MRRDKTVALLGTTTTPDRVLTATPQRVLTASHPGRVDATVVLWRKGDGASVSRTREAQSSWTQPHVARLGESRPCARCKRRIDERELRAHDLDLRSLQLSKHSHAGPLSAHDRLLVRREARSKLARTAALLESGPRRERQAEPVELDCDRSVDARCSRGLADVRRWPRRASSCSSPLARPRVERCRFRDGGCA
jgi:hypothetical protein